MSYLLKKNRWEESNYIFQDPSWERMVYTDIHASVGMDVEVDVTEKDVRTDTEIETKLVIEQLIFKDFWKLSHTLASILLVSC